MCISDSVFELPVIHLHACVGVSAYLVKVVVEGYHYVGIYMHHMCMSDSVLRYTSMHRCECTLLDLVFPIGRREV